MNENRDQGSEISDAETQACFLNAALLCVSDLRSLVTDHCNGT
jgi:hypothetical protein